MRAKMLAILLPAWLAILVTLMPPGLCPCWLMQYPGNHHPHFGIVPELPHSHDYLFTYFQSHTAPAAPSAAGSLAALLDHLGAAPSRALTPAAGLHLGWKSPVGRPPPRA